jgi:hypothetical protein
MEWMIEGWQIACPKPRSSPGRYQAYFVERRHAEVILASPRGVRTRSIAR